MDAAQIGTPRSFMMPAAQTRLQCPVVTPPNDRGHLGSGDRENPPTGTAVGSERAHLREPSLRYLGDPEED